MNCALMGMTENVPKCCEVKAKFLPSKLKLTLVLNGLALFHNPTSVIYRFLA